jgi:hypothetical protein
MGLVRVGIDWEWKRRNIEEQIRRREEYKYSI